MSLDVSGFDHVETWVFDLDNTLYPAGTDVFPQVHARMGEFIARHFEITLEEANEMRRAMYLKHGTTLRGLMVEHDVEADHYLKFVHDIDLSNLPREPGVIQALERLPGRKLIFTNASRYHAEKITTHLGIDHIFEGVFDILAADFIPKPDARPYDVLIERFGFDPKRACMVEDIPRNLVPAAARGMKTVWVKPAAPEYRERELVEGAEGADLAVDALLPWLEAVNARRSTRAG
jgi:putative hydrolase of the HAD superfamily